MGLEYRDFRPIREGDKGWTPELQKSRHYYSPSTGEKLTLRKFQEKARGASYTEFVKQRQAKGEQPRRNKPRTPAPSGKPIEVVVKPKHRLLDKYIRKEKPGRMHTLYVERAMFMKERFAEKISNEYGYQVDWTDMSDEEKTTFWEVYHDMVDDNKPSRDEFLDYYSDFFDGDYEDFDFE